VQIGKIQSTQNFEAQQERTGPREGLWKEQSSSVRNARFSKMGLPVAGNSGPRRKINGGAKESRVVVPGIHRGQWTGGLMNKFQGQN